MMANMTRFENVIPVNTSRRLVDCLRLARSGSCCLRGLYLRASLGLVAHLFQAVSALPKEQVRGNGCAQDGDQEGQIGLVELEVGNQGVA